MGNFLRKFEEKKKKFLCEVVNKYFCYQAFTNYKHGYDRALNVQVNGIPQTRKFVHVTDSCVKII